MGGLRVLLSAVAAAAAVSAAPFQGCATVEADGSIRRDASSGAVCSCGASFPNSLYQLATLTYSGEYGEVSYTATGSSTGKESITKSVVDFAGSDSLLSESNYATAPDLQMYPATAAAVVPFVNLKEVEAAGGRVVVDRATLPLIFLGDIYEWTDPRLLALQSAGTRAALLGMADPAINVVVRDDGSGTSEIFTKALSSFSADFAARIGGGDVLDWCEDGGDGLCFGAKGECEGVAWVFDSGFGTSGSVTCNKTEHHGGGRAWQYTRGSKTAGMVAAVRSIPGAIGYGSLADVLQARIPQALVVNRAGQALEAVKDTVSYSLFEFAGLIDERGNADLFDAYSTFAYPIVGFTYFVLRKGVDGAGAVHMPNTTASMFDCSTRLRTLSYLEWFYTSEVVAELAANLGFTNLPGFIASSIVDKMLEENYCREDGGPVRRVKEREIVESRSIVSGDLAAGPAATASLVYRETEPTVKWVVNITQGAGELAALEEASSIADSEDELGVVSLDGLGATDLPAGVFAAPLFLVGIAPLYHLSGVDDLALSLEQVASILLGEVTTWAALRADLAATAIQLVVRTDDCDSNEIVTARLSALSPTFAATIGVTRVMDASTLAGLGVAVVAVTSREELESTITFLASSMAVAWERTGVAPAEVADLNVSSSVLSLDSPSLAACMSAEASVSLTSAQYLVESRFYDASRSTATGCWPFARAYNLIVSEALIGPDPCSPLAPAFFADFEASRALAFARWMYTSDVASAFESAHLGTASAADTAAAASRLLVTSVCVPPKPDEEKQLVSTGLKAFMIALAFVNYLIVVVCVAWTVRYRRRVIVRLSQPTYLYFLCLGSLITVTSSLSPLFGPTDLACQLMVWMYGMGFATTQATLFTKMQQMNNVIEYSLQMKTKARSIKVHRREIGQVVGVIFGGEAAILLAWGFFAPLGYKRSCIEREKDSFWDGACVESVGKCRTTHGVLFVAVLASYHVLCVCGGMYMCYKIRNLPSVMSEGKWVFTAFYSQLQGPPHMHYVASPALCFVVVFFFVPSPPRNEGCAGLGVFFFSLPPSLPPLNTNDLVFITAVPVLTMVSDDMASFTILKSLVICLGDLTTMGMIYAPKMALIYQYHDFSRSAVSKLVSQSLSNSTQKNVVYESLRVKRAGTHEDGDYSSRISITKSANSKSPEMVGRYMANPSPSAVAPRAALRE